MGELPFDSRMGRRIGFALGLCAVLPVLVFAALAARTAWLSLTLTLVLALAGALLASAYLVRRYGPALRALATGLAALRTREFVAIDVRSWDEARLLIESFNRAAAGLDEQFRALETLEQIDQLLL